MRLARRVGLVAAAFIAAWLLLCHYRYDEVFICSACGASEFRSRWYVGVMPLGSPVLHDFGSVHGPGALCLTSQTIRLTASPATTYLFPATHSHRWHFAGANPLYLFGTRWGGCVTGGSRGPSSPFAFVYLQDPAFVDYIEALIRAGTYTRADVLSLFEGAAVDATRLTDDILAQYWHLNPNPDRQRAYRAIYHGA